MRTSISAVFLSLFLVVVGFGCIQQQTPGSPSEEVVTPTTAEVRDLVGVLQTINITERSAEIGLVDGSVEQVVLPESMPLEMSSVGLLLKFSGTRELSTRIITVSDASVIESPNLYVVAPAPGSTVTSPLLVTGFGRTFEQTFSWRIKDVSGAIVANGYAMTHAPDVGIFGPFQFEVFLPAFREKEFTLEVYEASAKDGSDTNLVSVPLSLLSTATSTFDIYFSHTKENPNALCELVFPVTRKIAQTSAIGRAALLELLAGPTESEAKAGYTTNFPENVSLNSLVISNGVATADFTAALNQTAGSCRVTAIRSQIVNTLNQFESVEEIVVSVEGDAETALQP